MTIRDKIEALKKVQGYREEISEILEKIIQRTYDYHCEYVNKFTVCDKSINVDYWYTCHGEHGCENIDIPIKWLDEEFDYKSAYEEELRKAELARIREEENEKRRLENLRKARAKLRKEREYKKYLELKKKYES